MNASTITVAGATVEGLKLESVNPPQVIGGEQAWFTSTCLVGFGCLKPDLYLGLGVGTWPTLVVMGWTSCCGGINLTPAAGA
jgi:hypothetical protein